MELQEGGMIEGKVKEGGGDVFEKGSGEAEPMSIIDSVEVEEATLNERGMVLALAAVSFRGSREKKRQQGGPETPVGMHVN